MPRGNPVAARMEDERFTLAPLVLLHLAEKNNMIPTVKLANIPTNKVGSGSFQQRASGGPLRALHAFKFVGQRRGKLPGQVMLVCPRPQRRHLLPLPGRNHAH